jgi:hypothetical protein
MASFMTAKINGDWHSQSTKEMQEVNQRYHQTFISVAISSFSNEYHLGVLATFTTFKFLHVAARTSQFI